MTKRASSLGELEQLVLLALVHQDNFAYGKQVVDEIEQRLGEEVSIGAVYTTLDRLEHKSLLRSITQLRKEGGKPKRFYSVTSAGLNTLERNRASMDKMWEGVDFVHNQ